jgi:hypothetical protein
MAGQRIKSQEALSCLAISRIRDEPLFMIAAVSPWWYSEFTLERPVESSFRLIPYITGDFCDTSRCPFK